MGPVIRTLGHSRHTLDRFAELARAHGVETVVDVRGQPFSRFNPQFNREPFRDGLAAHGIGYLWEGERLSGRPKDRAFYLPDGKLDIDALRAWPALADGIAEITELAGREAIALVCAEEDPLRCHRRFLLTPPLQDRNCAVIHIRGDGTLETEAETAQRAAPPAKTQMDLFG